MRRTTSAKGSSSRSRARRGAFERLGRNLDRGFSGANQKIVPELERIITYLNDEVVPSVREHSSRAIRKAAQQLSSLADYMEKQKQGQ